LGMVGVAPVGRPPYVVGGGIDRDFLKNFAQTRRASMRRSLDTARRPPKGFRSRSFVQARNGEISRRAPPGLSCPDADGSHGGDVRQSHAGRPGCIVPVASSAAR
jgi:hypothetical protein